MIEDKESIIFHLEALRQTLLKCIYGVGIVFIPALFVAPKILDIFIKLILRGHNIALNYFSPAEVFLIQIKFAFVLAIIIAFPYIAKQIWDFCVPALYEHEKKFIKNIVFTSSSLFIIGSIFCLFIILPLIINFGISFSSPTIQAVFGISNVVTLSMWLILAFGIMFQLPLITYSLIKSGITEYNSVKNCRPYVIVGILLIAGFLTPPDIISQLLLFIPTYLLFETGLLLSRGKNGI